MIKDKKNELDNIIKMGREIIENPQNKELYDDCYMYNYIDIENQLKSDLQKAADEGRKLTIGVIGAVKAGKSSFLNALLFDGEQYLPKAITPSTATLTKITYSNTPKAVIHFFNREDWNRIDEYVNKYNSKLEEKYTEYRRNNENKKTKENEKIGLLNLEEYENKIFRGLVKDERMLSAVELNKMATKNDILDKLNQKVEIEGNVIAKLDEYIDAKGKYTAIVKNVELMVDNPNLNGIEIVDTPGLCDPVVSRGNKTKQELHNCDVVFLLSSVCEFLPADTINLMVNSLPSAGVDEVIVVGSRFDDGITDNKGGDFLEKAKKTKDACEKTFKRNMEIIKNSGYNNSFISKIEKSDRLYISSMCYVLDKKINKKVNFTEEENKVYKQLKNDYSGFKDSYLSAISGINEVRKKLNSVLKRKEQIIAENDNKIIDNAVNNFEKILSDVKTYVETNNIKLRSMSKDEIEEKSQKIKDALIMSRKQVTSLFETTGIGCEKKLISLKSILTLEMANYTNIKVDTENKEDISTINAGFLGWRKDVVKTNIVTNKSSTSNVKMNITTFNARCIQIVNDEFTSLFNKDLFTRQIKEIIMKAFEAGNADYEKEDILLPVEKLLMKLTIPEVRVDESKYIDTINSRYTKGFAENDEIHELNSMQIELLGKIKNDYESQVTENGHTISRIMEQESCIFSNEIEKKFSSDMQKLLSQMEEQEKYINLNTDFAKQLEECITKFKEMKHAII